MTPEPSRIRPGEPMKVCLILRYFTVGGLERVVSSLANGYAARGIQTRVLILSGDLRNALVTELDPRIDIQMLAGPHQLRALRALTRGYVVHIQFGDGYIMPLVRTGLLGRQLVVSYHNVYRHKRNWATNRADQLWAARADGIIAVSDAVRDFCIQDVGIPADRVRVIPNGIPFDPCTRPLDARAEGEPTVAVVLANVYSHKNHRAVLEALAIARRAGANLRVRFIGDGMDMARVYQRCRELGLTDVTDWYGAIFRPDQVQPLLGSSHVFVSASRFEGMPLSILEGMAHGLPMVLSDIDPHRELAGDGALYFDPNQPEALAKHLVSLHADRPLYRRLAEQSRARVREFEVDTMVERHLDVYRQVLAG
jgi:glycosyltransferase involved in cell wall biosynthesis